MDKEKILQVIIDTLAADLTTLSEAAKRAHAAATHSECLPDNKYDTTGLEASYVAQGQANRAQEIRQSLKSYYRLEIRTFDDEQAIRLTALVTLQTEDGEVRQVFLGPAAGGLKIVENDVELIVITPESPLGCALLGKVCGEDVHTGAGTGKKTFTIIRVV